jgi:hypothetical protein
VLSQERQFGFGCLFVAVEERGVVAAGQPDQFAAGCALGSVGRGSGQCRPVVLADQHEQRNRDAVRMSAGAIQAEGQR